MGGIILLGFEINLWAVAAVVAPKYEADLEPVATQTPPVRQTEELHWHVG
jgi:hypothetical protein